MEDWWPYIEWLAYWIRRLAWEGIWIGLFVNHGRLIQERIQKSNSQVGPDAEK